MRRGTRPNPKAHLIIGIFLFLVMDVGLAWSSSLDRFVRDYRRAWSSPSPVLLLDMAIDSSIFVDLTREDRWDHLAFSRVKVRLIRHSRGVGDRITLEIERDQRDRFIQGTYAMATIRERLVVQRHGGAYRILRYEGVRGRARSTASPETWGSGRAGERSLMRALEALADHAPERCTKHVEALFGAEKPDQLAVTLVEPFKGSQTAHSNAFYVRAACSYMSYKMKGQRLSGDEGASTPGTLAEEQRRLAGVLKDLDRAIDLDGKHLLARLLRARLLITVGDFLPVDQVDARLKMAHGDLELIDQTSPELEDAAELRILLGVAMALREDMTGETGAQRRKLFTVLTNSDGILGGELLARLGPIQHLAIVAPEVLPLTVEISLSAGRVAQAGEILLLIERSCPQCVVTKYLRGREAERLALPSAAIRLYADVLRLEPSFRDAVWRFTSLVYRHESEQNEEATKLLAAAARGLPFRERTALMILLAVDAGSRDHDEILNMMVDRFPNDPLPPFLRVELANHLSKP